MTFTPDIISKIGLGIFRDTGMAESEEEAQFLWDWAVSHKRIGVGDHEAVFYFFQMIAHHDPDKAAAYLRIKPWAVRRNLGKPCANATDSEFKRALMRKHA